MLNGSLAKYLDDPQMAKDLAQALKIAINSVYGLTAANFENALRDPRNRDNIVAKRGALFMVNLKHEVQRRGFTVAHVKTDSIKIPNATPEIIQFVMDYGKQYGYSFEHEATYDRMCLVNDAVYIARYKNDDGSLGDWTATGTQFQVPYVYKKLFTKEPILFEDMCETNSVTTAIYLDMNEALSDVSVYETALAIRQSLALDPNKKLTKKEQTLLDKFEGIPDTELMDCISAGHDYHFVGKVGRFCPVKDGCGGGVLLREKDGKYFAVGGSKGYKWLEAEMVSSLNKQDDIDRSYYDKLVDTAAEAIAKYGDFEWFVSDDPYMGSIEPDETLPWLMPCGEEKYMTCFECPHFVDRGDHAECGLKYDISHTIMMTNPIKK